MIASNNSGVWNLEGDTLDFAVAHAFYQTNWFRALCVLTFLAMLCIIYKLRVRSLERRQAEIGAFNEQLIEAQEAERMRISGELHNIRVLQQVTSLTLRLGKVKRQVPPDSEATATVNSLQQQLIQIGTDIRQISHDLHPALLQDAGLPTALSAYCEEFGKVRGLLVTCETEDSAKDLSPGAALVSTASRRKHSAMPPSIRRRRKWRYGLPGPTVAFDFQCPTMELVATPTRSEDREGWG